MSYAEPSDRSPFYLILNGLATQFPLEGNYDEAVQAAVEVSLTTADCELRREAGSKTLILGHAKRGRWAGQ